MTEELEQKAEEWVKHNSDESIHSFDGEQLQKAYIAGATETTKELQVTRKDKAEGSLTFDFEPGPLYESKARTGRPKRVEVLPWQ